VFLLTGLGIASILVVVLWVLSPLGGQSSLRVLARKQAYTSDEQTLYYFDTSNSEGTMYEGASSLTYYRSSANAIYQACLLAPGKVQSSAVDLWNNVKIPMLEYLPEYTTKPDGSWLQVNETQGLAYSSMTGLMTAGLPMNHSSNFTAESSYFNLGCSGPSIFTIDRNANTTSDLDKFYGGFESWLGTISYHTNRSRGLFADPYTSDYNYYWNSFMVDANSNPTESGIGLPEHLNMIYASQGANTEKIFAYNCTVETTYVEANVVCNSKDCYVNRMRRSKKDTTPSNITPLNNQTVTYLLNFLANIPWAAGTIHSATLSPTDLYVGGSDSPYDTSLAQEDIDYTDVTGKEVSQRLGAVVNTLWQASLARNAIALEAPSNLTAVAAGDAGYHAAQVVATTRQPHTVYAASKLWTGLTALISIVLFLCGVAGQLFKYLAKAPDILGYVSSMTRDNPYFESVHGADRLDGLSRARLLRKVEVRIMDVKPWDERGHIALTSMNVAELEASRPE